MKCLVFLLCALVFASGCSSVYVPHEKSEPESEAARVLENLPGGWTGSVIEPAYSPTCPDKEALFSIDFEYPYVVCEITNGGGAENASPSFTIHYYPKFAQEDWEGYVACVARTGITAKGTAFRFADTDKHTIMTTFGNSCPEKDNSEIENYLYEYYGVI